MKKHSNKLGTQSRRHFTKSVAASLLVAPLASSLADGHNSMESSLAPQATPIRRNGCDLADDIFKKSDHIPPTELGVGSLLIQLGHKLQDQTDQSGPRPKRYIVRPASADEQYGDISVIQVLAELEHRFDYVAYTFEPDHKAQLVLWLQKVKKANPPESEEQDFEIVIPDNVPPNVLIKGGPPMVLEMDKGRGSREATNKRWRRHKYKHSGYGKNFRILKWRVVGSDGQTVLRDQDNRAIEGTGAESYRLMICFSDPTRRAQKTVT